MLQNYHIGTLLFFFIMVRFYLRSFTYCTINIREGGGLDCDVVMMTDDKEVVMTSSIA